MGQVMLKQSVSGSVESRSDVVLKARHVFPFGDESKNLPGLLNACQCRDLCRGGPWITCYPCSVQVVFNGCFHDDIHISIFGEHDDGLCRGFIDIAHQLSEPRVGLWTVLGEIARQDVSEFNAYVPHFAQDLNNVITAILPIFIITSYNGHCFPVKLLHQPSNSLCLMSVTRYGSQKSGELQLPAELLTSWWITNLIKTGIDRVETVMYLKQSAIISKTTSTKQILFNTTVTFYIRQYVRDDQPGPLMTEPELVQQLLILQSSFHQLLLLLLAPLKETGSCLVQNIRDAALRGYSAAGGLLWQQSWHLHKCRRCHIQQWSWAEPLVCADLFVWWSKSSLGCVGMFLNHTFKNWQKYLATLFYRLVKCFSVKGLVQYLHTTGKWSMCCAPVGFSVNREKSSNDDVPRRVCMQRITFTWAKTKHSSDGHK